MNVPASSPAPDDLALDAPVALLTVAQTRALDACAIARGVPGRALMEAAGTELARIARAAAPQARAAAVLCGPGANGGDGFVAARRLAAAGLATRVYLLGPRAALAGDAALAAADWTGEVLPLEDWRGAGDDLVIDALFGAGLSRPLSGAALEAVRRLAAWRGRGGVAVAADIPSGIDGDSGQALGEAAACDVTVTFVRRKPGHVLLPGRIACGRTVVVDIGQPEGCVAAAAGGLRTVGPAGWRAAWRGARVAGHKYERGHCVVVSGGMTQTGAARLAARAALRVGAGLATLAAPGAALAVAASHLTAIMLRRCDDAAALTEILSDRRLNAVALGPAGGVGARMREMTLAALASAAAATLDADALTSFAEEPEALFAAIKARALPLSPEGSEGEGRPSPAPGPWTPFPSASPTPGVTDGASVVLTPHEGEFARLFGRGEGSKLARAQAAAVASGAVVILKGADSVVAAPDGRAAMLDFDAPWLATAGSGDVLTGLVAGLTAQRVPAFEAGCAAVWLHAQAGRRLGPGLIAEDLPEALPAILRRLFAE